jgi:hypothetical protein
MRAGKASQDQNQLQELCSFCGTAGPSGRYYGNRPISMECLAADCKRGMSKLFTKSCRPSCRQRGFQSILTNTVAARKGPDGKRSFWLLASFRLSHRPLRACSFAKASPKSQKSPLRAATLFLAMLSPTKRAPRALRRRGILLGGGFASLPPGRLSAGLDLGDGPDFEIF